MINIQENLKKYLSEVASYDATLVAISKTKPVNDILRAYDAGHRDFGENKVQELSEKFTQLPKDIRWHMVGHLQRNKVKFIAPFVHLIHSVDSLRLLQTINKEAQKNNRNIDVLIQMHIASEDTKFGFTQNELDELIGSKALTPLHNINIVGLMGMATNTKDEHQVRLEFKRLKQIFDNLKTLDHPTAPVSILSMGMSGDYQIAMEEGSTMVRIGSAIFGERNYVR
jgi:pyridoxal phosphate enzyme (YggS family)